ncbi:unnamed protein product [Effrenium voratum]|nr:unnamed protein product [Effrenium voratum]
MGILFKSQELFRRLSTPRCLPVAARKSSKHSPRDAVQKLTDEVQLLTCPSSPESQTKTEELWKDVHNHLLVILNLLKELSENSKTDALHGRVKVTNDQLHVLEQFLAADLPVQLLSQLTSLEFEVRKDVMNVCCALLWPDLPEEVAAQVMEYVRFHPTLFSKLMDSYASDEAALFSGVVLRSFFRYGQLVETFLTSGKVFELIGYARHPSIDVAADALGRPAGRVGLQKEKGWAAGLSRQRCSTTCLAGSPKLRGVTKCPNSEEIMGEVSRPGVIHRVAQHPNPFMRIREGPFNMTHSFRGKRRLRRRRRAGRNRTKKDKAKASSSSEKPERQPGEKAKSKAKPSSESGFEPAEYKEHVELDVQVSMTYYRIFGWCHRVMMNYVSNEPHLKIIMNLLLADSKSIQSEAFHVFKIFVVNPQKPLRIQQILVKNKDRLVALLQTLQSGRSEDANFNTDQQKVIGRLLEMNLPIQETITRCKPLEEPTRVTGARHIPAQRRPVGGQWGPVGGVKKETKGAHGSNASFFLLEAVGDEKLRVFCINIGRRAPPAVLIESGGRHGRRKIVLPPGHFSRIYRIIGRIVAARGLPNTDANGKSDPYCVLKGIRSNNHMANIWVTKAVQNTLSPHWEEEFDFMIPAEWGLVELVGLKAMVFDADDFFITYQGNEDFLGGCDIDLSNAVSGRAMTHELELAGIPMNKAKGKKPRLTIVVTVYKEVIPKPKPLFEQLVSSMREMHYVREVAGKVIKAQEWLAEALRPGFMVEVETFSATKTQLHEGRLNKNGAKPEKADEARASSGEESLNSSDQEVLDMEKPKQSCLDRLSKAAVDIREKVKSVYYLQKVERSCLTVELRTRIKTEPMPLMCFLDKATYIADEDDAERVLSLKDWDRCMYPPPPEITVKGRPPRGELSGKQQICFVQGVVRGASGLPAADDNDLSDPFCIVEAMSRNAEKIFVHRTRVVKNKLCPEWNEVFYMALPPTFELNRLMFSIYDRDETMGALLTNQLDPLEQDEFLGRASIDISYLKSGDKLEEDIPVSGSVVGNKVKTTTGFRRTATIAVEVSVQRRVKPAYGLAPEDHSAVIPRRTHKVSRPPNTFPFADPSQFIEDLPLEEQIAGEIMEAYNTGRLRGGNSVEWLHTPESRPLLDLQLPEEEAPEALPHTKAPPPEPPVFTYPLRPGTAGNSLPVLHSKFEQPKPLFDMTQESHRSCGPTSMAIRQVFNGNSTMSIVRSLRGLWNKPMPETLVHRSLCSSAEQSRSTKDAMPRKNAHHAAGNALTLNPTRKSFRNGKASSGASAPVFRSRLAMDADELQPLLLRYSLHHAAPEPQPAAHQQRYASQDFWDARFQDSEGLFDWYATYEELRDAFEEFCPPSRDKVLVVGCGNSAFSAELLVAGYGDITSIDISSAAIEKMRKQFPQPGLTWRAMDCTQLAFGADSFRLACDKGTLDALMSGARDSAQQMVREVWRVLEPGGFFVLVSHSGRRLPLLRGSLGEAEAGGGAWRCLERRKARLSPQATFINALRASLAPGRPLAEAFQNPEVLQKAAEDARAALKRGARKDADAEEKEVESEEEPEGEKSRLQPFCWIYVLRKVSGAEPGSL